MWWSRHALVGINRTTAYRDEKANGASELFMVKVSPPRAATRWNYASDFFRILISSRLIF